MNRAADTVGTLVFTNAGKVNDATLHNDGKWTCTDELWAAYLNLFYNPIPAYGLEAILPFGHLVLSQAGRQLQASVVFTHPPVPLKPGQIS